MSDGALPESAWILALLSLPALGPARLRRLLDRDPPRRCWERLSSGQLPPMPGVSAEVVSGWHRTARALDVGDRWWATAALGIDVHARGDAGYPARLAHDPEPPELVFARGAPIPDTPTVAVVGTRRCTSYGRRVAFELAADLSRGGVSIVSGLALGIDAAAHQGALSVSGTAPVGVVGSGLDVVYPQRNRSLWQQVAAHGSLLSESPPGAPPEAWRFPARNRIIAGLADAVVVVESHAAGGSLHTVDQAQLRDVPVGAVPGPISSSASEGTNQLIAEGAVPVLGPTDVLLMIGHVPPRRSAEEPPRSPAEPIGPEPVSASARRLLDAMGREPMVFEQLCLLLPADPVRIAADLEELVGAGRCVRTGPWVERVD